MSIDFDAGPPSRPKAHRNVSAPSLINRIEKPPLLDRLSTKEPKAKSAAPVASTCVPRHALYPITYLLYVFVLQIERSWPSSHQKSTREDTARTQEAEDR